MKVKRAKQKPRTPSKTLLSQKLRELREQHNLTQIQFARRCGISRTHLAGFESQRLVPSFTTLNKLNKLFGVDSFKWVKVNSLGRFIHLGPEITYQDTNLLPVSKQTTISKENE